MPTIDHTHPHNFNITTVFDYSDAMRCRKAGLQLIPTNQFPPGIPTENEGGNRAYFAVIHEGTLDSALSKAGV